MAVASRVASLAGTEWFVSNCRADESNTYNRKEEKCFLWSCDGFQSGDPLFKPEFMKRMAAIFTNM